ncbi:helix-turn-helix domain-containing protein [Nocardioides sp. Kera G14]|uniref:helix-turn-helix domain-containing protein n=1 Tax=Nocardioides sp. Kera G14 TaxID=2884264 RepID=UPI001D11AD1F|nr:helix-turn-helix transcriptional regulator [Nocardioides sp. Kera G14]UDY22929.1 helix-turn-helix domain-containing protein [Nocardioides sp. Kera G14]
MDRNHLIEQARRSCGLTQVELAARAGTSQATLSAYERGLKSPSLKVAGRILAATGHELTLRTFVDWTEHRAPGINDFSVPDRLWPVAPPMCFATITMMPDLIGHSGKSEWNLLDRGERIGAYEQLIRFGLSHQMIRWIDGGLLIDVWGELELPDPVRAAWEPAIRTATEAPRDDALRFMSGTAWVAASARIGRTKRLSPPPPPAPSPPPPRPRRSRFDPRPPP